MLYHVISTIDYHELLCSIPLILFQSIASYRLRHLRWHASEGSGAWKAPLPGGPKGAKKQRRPGRHIGSLGELPRSRLLDELNTIIFIFVFLLFLTFAFCIFLFAHSLLPVARSFSGSFWSMIWTSMKLSTRRLTWQIPTGFSNSSDEKYSWRLNITLFFPRKGAKHWVFLFASHLSDIYIYKYVEREREREM